MIGSTSHFDRALRCGLVGIALLGPSCIMGVAAETSRRPNVVIILTDDQGTLDARCYGSQDLYTPAIDKIAALGVRFTQAYAHSVCCPARAMLLTGRHPQRGNVNSWMQGSLYDPKGRNMLLSEVTLAEVLKGAGYRTALFGKWHLGAHRDHGPTRQGFDEFFGFRDGFIDNYVHYQLHRAGFHDLFRGTQEVFRRGDYFPEMITDEALSFIARNQQRPFFLYFAINLPHYPEQALERFTRYYHELPEPRRSYAAAVSTADDCVLRILTRLESLKLLQDTIVVFMSDNGYSAEDYQIEVDGHASGYPRGHKYGANGGGGNTGRWLGAKGSFLEGGIRVPALLSYPRRIPGGLVRHQAITAMDWFPTVLELCGLKPPPGVILDGHSLLPIIQDSHAPSPYGVMHWQWQKGWMVRDGDWKLIVNGSYGIGRPKLPDVYLANLSDNPPESVNHAAEHPEIVRRLRERHDQWVREVTPPNLPETPESLP
ncbi:MAG: sulfatase-like hydrolase/transferase [Planctomycetes bacterium]|nr:sulfatase-like hydrolase/transferase [Planctomycetota bacterium]